MNEPSSRTDETMDAELHRKQREPFFRFHLPYASASSVFGEGWFASRAEAFAGQVSLRGCSRLVMAEQAKY